MQTVIEMSFYIICSILYCVCRCTCTLSTLWTPTNQPSYIDCLFFSEKPEVISARHVLFTHKHNECWRRLPDVIQNATFQNVAHTFLTLLDIFVIVVLTCRRGWKRDPAELPVPLPGDRAQASCQHPHSEGLAMSGSPPLGFARWPILLWPHKLPRVAWSCKCRYWLVCRELRISILVSTH